MRYLIFAAPCCDLCLGIGFFNPAMYTKSTVCCISIHPPSLPTVHHMSISADICVVNNLHMLCAIYVPLDALTFWPWGISFIAMHDQCDYKPTSGIAAMSAL